MTEREEIIAKVREYFEKDTAKDEYVPGWYIKEKKQAIDDCFREALNPYMHIDYPADVFEDVSYEMMLTGMLAELSLKDTPYTEDIAKNEMERCIIEYVRAKLTEHIQEVEIKLNKGEQI